MPETPRYFAVAHLLKPRGNKGELAAEILTDFPERLTKLQQVFLAEPQKASEPRPITIKNCWLSQNHQGQAVFHFENINSINDAEKLRGLDVLLPIDQRVSLPAGRYFVADLIGCEVFEAASPQSRLGLVADVEFPGETLPGTPLLVVSATPEQLLIPLAQDICTTIDITARRIEVLLPEGLRDLNAAE
ncbi:MAG: ribosome maturation factor RimM [Candidatus Acidiferrum sp.]